MFIVFSEKLVMLFTGLARVVYIVLCLYLKAKKKKKKSDKAFLKWNISLKDRFDISKIKCLKKNLFCLSFEFCC